jgi:hypothetical protein
VSHRAARALVAIGLVGLAAGCAGRYVEPLLADDQVVTVEAEGPVLITGIDGLGVGWTDRQTRVRVAPGERSVSVAFLPPAGSADGTRLVVTALPGQTYRIRGRVRTIPIWFLSGSWEASAVHVATGAVVATGRGVLRSR